MPKSKRSLKRRKKVKNRNKSRFPVDDFNYGITGDYMKTDGQSRVCVYDKNHNFLRFATDEESENF